MNRKIILMIFLIFHLGGCASFRIGQLPHLTSKNSTVDNCFLKPPSDYLLGHGDKLKLVLSNSIPFNKNENKETLYRLDLGDIIEINFFNHWQFNVTRTIRPDGFITVPYCGDIKARGKTTEELASDIARCYSRIIESPCVTVNLYLLNTKRFKEIEGEYVVQNDGYIILPVIGRLKAAGKTLELLSEDIKKHLSKIYFDKLDVKALLSYCANNKFYIGGEVKRPGIYDINPNLTVLQALFKAGDAKPSGNLDNVVLIRRLANNKPEVRVLDLSGSLLDRNFAQDIAVHPYDIIFVPKTNIAGIRQFLDDYLFDLLHLSTTMGFYYTKEVNGTNF